MRTEEAIAASAVDERAFSNGSEYEIWAGRYCYECVHDDPRIETFCPILSVALLGRWPAEWTRHQVKTRYGQYEAVDTCTEFEQPRDDDGDDEPPSGPGPFEPEIPGQVDIFTVFVEQGIEQLAPDVVPA